jgi:hypothetical protein
MASKPQTIKVEVPEGFLPQNMPVKEEERIAADSIRVEMITKDDLLTIVRIPPFSHNTSSNLCSRQKVSTPPFRTGGGLASSPTTSALHLAFEPNASQSA